ncbi:lipopolysaccharide biosynthesis protein [Sodaliphilus sp.]|uniref:lipopolysaccharide biosynthesis protein n=1 Tax=Sodaliphilus sp. TaxID=2815818 RepID=UPI00389030B7
MEQGNLRSKTVNGVIWSFIERFSVQGVVFVLDLIIARLIGPDNYGLIAMLAIFMSISQVFIDGGFSSALIQRKDRSESDFSTVFYINIGISILTYLALFFSAPAIARFFNQPILDPITKVYSINLVINSLVAVNRTKLTIDVDFKTQSKISFYSAVLSGVVGVVLAYLGYGVWALVIQSLALAALNVLLSFYYVRWFPRAGFSVESFKSLFSFGSKLLAANVISALYAKAYDVVIGKRFNKADLGLYSRADKFNQFASSNIGGVLARVSFPVLSAIQNDDVRLKAAYKKYMQISALVVFPLILGMCGVARPMIETLLGQDWLGCVPMLQILAFAYLWDCVVTVNLNLIYVKGHSDYVLKLEVIKKAIAFGILAITLFFDSLVAICWGRVIYSLIAFYLNTYYTNKLLNYGFFTQLKELSPILAMSLTITGIALGLSWMVSNALLSLLISLAVCPVVYVLMCHILKVEAYSEVLDIIKSKLNGLKG